jgi:hypothetical protein
MKNFSSIIGWFLLLIALGLYLYGVSAAIFNLNLIPQKNAAGGITGYMLPEILDTLTATIGAILLTNLGAVLGISVTQPQSGLAAKTLMTKVALPNPITRREIIQLTAVLVYLVTLVACFIKWATNNFDNGNVATLVSQNGKMLIGVISAYVAFAVGK